MTIFGSFSSFLNPQNNQPPFLLFTVLKTLLEPLESKKATKILRKKKILPKNVILK